MAVVHPERLLRVCCGGAGGLVPPGCHSILCRHSCPSAQSRRAGKQPGLWFPNLILPLQANIDTTFLGGCYLNFDTTIPVPVIFRGIKGKCSCQQFLVTGEPRGGIFLAVMMVLRDRSYLRDFLTYHSKRLPCASGWTIGPSMLNFFSRESRTF